MKHLIGNAVSALLLLLGSATTWAGPGDLDPNFGDAGRLGAEAMLVLPDDRIVITGPHDTHPFFYAARFNANGKIDATFGDGGHVLIPIPGAYEFRAFLTRSAVATPAGDLLFGGIFQDEAGLIEAVLRLDRNGHLVTSFGGRGDGFYRLTDAPLPFFSPEIPTTLMAIAVDADGRVLLGLRNWTADRRCGGPTSVVRLMPDGSPDATFGTGGLADVTGVDLCDGTTLFGARSDGSIVVGTRNAIVGLDVNGELDLAFGDGGRWSREAGGRLLPDGGILLVDRDNSSALLTKLDRSGQLDAAFGSGTGSVRLELGPALLGISGSDFQVDEFVLAPDGAHVYLKLRVLHADGTTACAGGIVRVSLAGRPDLSFGRQGLTCLDYGAFPFGLVASQRNGSLLVRNHNAYRLLMDATPSPGMLTMVWNGLVAVGEADRSVAVTMMRTAGRDGVASVGFFTAAETPKPPNYDYCDGPCPGGPPPPPATPGSDFEAASGRLEWADGDEGERDMVVAILDDAVNEPGEQFFIGITDPQGSAWRQEVGDTFTANENAGTYYFGSYVTIVDDDEAPPPTGLSPTDPPGSGNSGGGGSVSWTTLLVVSGLLLGRQRRRHTSRTVEVARTAMLRSRAACPHFRAPNERSRATNQLTRRIPVRGDRLSGRVRLRIGQLRTTENEREQIDSVRDSPRRSYRADGGAGYRRLLSSSARRSG